jgi:uncharacterized membrane protein YgaE (UPF0421/DUF939 family)
MARYLHTTIKMSLASVLAILLAELFSLNYPITAGILAVLSIQLTRTDSINLAIKRFVNAVIGIALFTVFFIVFGYAVYVFVLVTVLFIAASFATKLEIGIVPTLVLTSHLLLFGTFDWFMILNSVLLIGIAGIVSLMLNLVYPLNSKKALSGFSEDIDTLIIKDLRALATLLKQLDHLEESRYQHVEIRSKLKSMLKEAELVNKDILFDQDRQLMSYIKMRYAQMKRIHRIYTLASHIKKSHPYATLLAEYVDNLSSDIGRADKASEQLDKLHTLLEDYRQKPLPKTREAFETRALLYQMIFELETFLEEKIQYHKNYGV